MAKKTAAAEPRVNSQTEPLPNGPVFVGPNPDLIAQALAAPFDEGEVKYKPQAVSGNRALAVPFVDARVVQDRLDEVLGVMGWQDHYEALPEGSVICRLKVRIGDEWITKEDIGSQSEQPDEGDRRKAAFSDALKRAAVKFGVGRYLYRCKPQWVDYDPQRRQILKPPPAPRPAVAAPPAGDLPKGELSQPQRQKLHQLMMDGGVDPQVFADFCGIDSYERLHVKDFMRAHGLLSDIKANRPLGQERWELVKGLMEECGADEAGFCEAFKIDAPWKLHLADYMRAVVMLRKKVAIQKKKAGGDGAA